METMCRLRQNAGVYERLTLAATPDHPVHFRSLKMSEQIIPADVEKTLIGKVDGKSVFLVDGDEIKVKYEMDYL